MHIDRLVNSMLKTTFVRLGVCLALMLNVAHAASLLKAELPVVKILAGKKIVLAEVANTDASRQTGLMNRPELPENKGMLFVFRHADTQCMWMKNTLIDLDVAFADESGRILNVEQMKAGTTDIHCSQGLAKLALEMNLNWFANNNVGKGNVLVVPDSARTGY